MVHIVHTLGTKLQIIMEFNEKKVYFNKSQRLTLFIGANTTVIGARRGTGKTDSISAPFVQYNNQNIIVIQYSFNLIINSIVSLNMSFGKRFMYVARRL